MTSGLLLLGPKLAGRWTTASAQEKLSPLMRLPERGYPAGLGVELVGPEGPTVRVVPTPSKATSRSGANVGPGDPADDAALLSR